VYELFSNQILKEPFALILSHVEVSKGRAAQILTPAQHFAHHAARGCMLRRAQHERFLSALHRKHQFDSRYFQRPRLRNRLAPGTIAAA